MAQHRVRSKCGESQFIEDVPTPHLGGDERRNVDYSDRSRHCIARDQPLPDNAAARQRRGRRLVPEDSAAYFTGGQHA